MIRSLRMRFFLIVWPLVVAATVGVGWYFGRWTRVEAHRELRVEGSALDLSDLGLADSAAAMLSAVPAPDIETLHAGLDRLAGRAREAGYPGPNALLVDAAGVLVASSSPGFAAETLTVEADGTLQVERQGERTGEHIRMRAQGWPLEVPEGLTLLDGVMPTAPLRLYVIPTPSVQQNGDNVAVLLGPSLADELAGADSSHVIAGESGRLALADRIDDVELAEFLDRANRTILTAVLAASLIAALATLLLARPVVGRAGRLAMAARRIREGDLSARVPSPSADELGDVEAAFNDMAEELQRSEALKRRLVSDAAHELRTPLTNLVGTLEAVEDGLREADAATLASLREEVGLLERLVEDLQEVAVADAGVLHLDLEEVDLVAAARRAIAGFEAVAGTKGVTFRLEANEAPPACAVRADRNRTGQIFRNLLRNAITHSPPGGEVRVVIAPRGADVEVAIADRGAGISADHLDLIWERFYRVDDSRDRASGGIGLGLAIVKRLVEAQGGRVRADSRPGHGATFRFTLPSA